ncbi:MAG: hypothetical protein FWC77_08080 [Defluviitaleaceae bacterium]|nr:hypothetical protein [Defluviitaleaceae bacterium]
MNYIHDLTQGTAMLTKAIGVLQGTRWDGNQEEARQYLISMDMDVAFASSLVADMEASNFTWAVHNLTTTGYATTGHKSIAIWVRKFGFEANLAASGDFWEITAGQAAHSGDTWDNNGDGSFNMNMREYIHSYMPSGVSKRGCFGIIALIIAVIVFVGAWMITGSIWAAIYFFEVIFYILIDVLDAF